MSNKNQPNPELWKYDLFWIIMIGIMVVTVIFSLIERARIFSVLVITVLITFIILFKYGRKSICQEKKSIK